MSKFASESNFIISKKNDIQLRKGEKIHKFFELVLNFIASFPPVMNKTEKAADNKCVLFSK